MSATDELRRMLDERGVHWWAGDDERITLWESSSLTWEYFNDENGDAWLGFLGACEQDIAPEQAIEATLGPRVQPPAMPEQPPYDLLIDLLRDEWDIEVMWDGLRRFWYVGLTDEGVRKRDEREATLGRGTCRDVCAGISEFTCSSCGFNCDLTSWISMFDGDEGRHRHHHHGAPNYCPNCGRKVVSE